MNNTKMIYGLTSFLIGASTMFLLGKHMGEKKVKNNITSKIKSEIKRQENNEEHAEFMQNYSNSDNSTIFEPDDKISYAYLSKVRCNYWKARKDEAQKSKEFLENLIK